MTLLRLGSKWQNQVVDLDWGGEGGSRVHIINQYAFSCFEEMRGE